MKQVLLISLTLGLLLGGLIVTATADDIQPPWFRGLPRTTSQMWEFNEPVPPGTPIEPDGPAPGGLPPLPSTYLTVWPLNGEYIPYDENSGRMGIWPLSGHIDVLVDNYPEPLEKTMWVQLTWQSQDPMNPLSVPTLYGFDAYPEAAQTPAEIVATEDLGFGWFETTYTWEIIPNPQWESFQIGGTINVDELVIDTICPEPSTFVLLGLGAMLLGIYGWRRKHV
jgi:hypothetical protein